MSLNLKTYILSELLHRANRQTNSEHFYAIKKRILEKYGEFKYYDVQFIEGKRCFTCGGTGIYHGYYERFSGWCSESCNNCIGTGYYRDPVWNILERLQFGKYIFHSPWKRSYTKPDITTPVINGYIKHDYHKHGELCTTILFLMYDRKRFITKWKKDIGFGWRLYWWLPRNWVNNIAHLIKNGSNSVPIKNMKNKITEVSIQASQMGLDDDNIPF